MARRKKNVAVEGEDHAPTPDEETVAEESPPEDGEVVAEEDISTPEEAPVEPAAAAEVGPPDTTKIKFLAKGPIRGADGHPIATGQVGEVASAVADALVGRGQAEYV